MNDTLIYPNGIDALTGEPLLPPLTVDIVSQMAQGQSIAQEELDELRERQRMLAGEADYGVMADVDPNDLAQAGWGVIFASDDPDVPAIRAALSPLLALRREQAGDRYRDETVAPKFLYKPGESKNTWLARNGGAPGPVDPRKLPYYLLIVGDPQRIPYTFQYLLDGAHAVGRIHFDTLDEYHSYAASVVAAEETGVSSAAPGEAAFFGVHNKLDRATALSAQHLVTPLAAAMEGKLAHWRVRRLMQEQASKAQLARLLGGGETPAFLFAASHGMGFPGSGHPRQRAEQGALICSDWPGQGIPRGRHFLAAEDIGSDAHLHGLIAFFFACYGAGTPRHDDFALRTRQKELQERGQRVTGLEQYDPIEIAPQPFVARLPQRLLGHPNGGALAVVGHVDRAWGSSFIWEGAQQVATFESALTRLLAGERLGYAVEDFNNRYAELSTELTARIQAIQEREEVPPEELAGLWTANNDARSYVILGDPAVKLAAIGATAPRIPSPDRPIAPTPPETRLPEAGDRAIDFAPGNPPAVENEEKEDNEDKEDKEDNQDGKIEITDRKKRNAIKKINGVIQLFATDPSLKQASAQLQQAVKLIQSTLKQN